MYFSVKVDEEKCIGCKICIFTCPEPNAIMLTENKKVCIDTNRCKGCFLCVSVCPKKALERGSVE
ncbi:MAG TPA: 4Fe-4S dicluster domain-containing protein [Ruminiclostridium sp.]|jgi:Pyruvate/2-oxoacid:ferredoxin oxidoreductase delta subunit|uniref:Ferredoxin-2 n=1 Tax=Acetivibrio saccincola TaxID=1677857 RepID=A0A2K9E187_9FIRM|nr:4Fe-4S dicluster-binding protein [Acetivibrio saccincola]AUG57532.1 Ferredoxin-2 [Acetivibrio saccincola]NLW26030.1 4Fe-4S binding protein [Acetivibrio saccincola]HAA42546.1 4Fe-4S dicluster domain-containing protein [Ruminiclostridium sp.]HQD29532.1 4Fe-4S binding protein [Acetivibrio saccincola]